MEGDGTHTGLAFNDFLIGGLPAATRRKMHFEPYHDDHKRFGRSTAGDALYRELDF